MKVIKSIVAAFLMVMIIGNTALAAEEDSEAKPSARTDDIIAVDSTYEFVSKYGYRYYIAVCKNTSEKDLDVSWDTVSYDESGSILETGSSYSSYVSPGQNFILYALFLNSEEAVNYSYKIHYEDSSYMHPAYKDVDFEASVSKNGSLILQATNTSDSDLSTIQAATLFFDADGTLIGFEDSYIVNSNYNVEAGETVLEDIRIPEGTDNYITYYTAYRW